MRQAAVLLCAFVLALTTVEARQGATAGQNPAATFRGGVNLVEVHAVVTDERGAFVDNLSKDDFEIYEAGKLQQPTVFQLVDVPIDPPRAGSSSGRSARTIWRRSSIPAAGPTSPRN